MTPYIVVIYSSSECVHVFASEHLTLANPYPKSVLYSCPLCNKSHLFNSSTYFHISTESIEKKFKDYCRSQNIFDLDVEIS